MEILECKLGLLNKVRHPHIPQASAEAFFPPANIGMIYNSLLQVRDTQDAKWVQVVPTANNGFPELVRLKKETVSIGQLWSAANLSMEEP